MELKSMTDFVLENTSKKLKDYSNKELLLKIRNYAKFLKQPLKLEMFVPCDDNGNVLEQPDKEFELSYWDYSTKMSKYEQAKEKVLFEGFDKYHFELKEHNVFVINEKIFSTEDRIENLLEYKGLEFNLTKNAIKQIGF